MRRQLVIMVLSAGFAAGSAAAQTTPSEDVLTTAPAGALPSPEAGPTVRSYAAQPDKDPIVCKSSVPIGSRLPAKSCARKSDLDRARRESQDMLQKAQRDGGGPALQRN